MINKNEFPKIYFGTGLSSSKDYESLKSHVKTCLINGIYAFDTAPSYKTEEFLGKAINENLKELAFGRKDVWIQTKIDGWQMQDSKGYIKPYIIDALNKMGQKYFDAVFVHWPFPDYFNETLASLNECKKEGLIKYVGICNVRLRHLKKIPINKYDICQLERHPLNTFIEEINFLHKNNKIVQDYSPLCKYCNKIKDNEYLKNIAKKYNKNIGQIILKWHIQNSTYPIFTSTKDSRIIEYSLKELDSFELTVDELNGINSLNINFKLYLESIACPGF